MRDLAPGGDGLEHRVLQQEVLRDRPVVVERVTGIRALVVADGLQHLGVGRRGVGTALDVLGRLKKVADLERTGAGTNPAGSRGSLTPERGLGTLHDVRQVEEDLRGRRQRVDRRRQEPGIVGLPLKARAEGSIPGRGVADSVDARGCRPVRDDARGGIRERAEVAVERSVLLHDEDDMLDDQRTDRLIGRRGTRRRRAPQRGRAIGLLKYRVVCSSRGPIDPCPPQLRRRVIGA